MFFRSRRKAALSTLAVGVALLALGLFWHHRRSSPAPVPVVIARPPAPAPVPAAAAPVSTRVPPRSNFIAACAPFHLDPGLLRNLITVARPVFNLAHIRAGSTLTLQRGSDGLPQALSYQIADNQVLWLRHRASIWTAAIVTTPYITHLAGVSGTVQSSLFGAVEAAGEQDELALDLNDIFAWDLDFNTDPRQGDVFRVLVEKKYLNGKFSGYGQIVAAEYVNDGKAYDALRFHDDLGMLAYYRPTGEPMKREFLRSPLKFAARISSGFSRHRYHPILKIYRAHLGIDFAAPTGSPVQTIGAGIVRRAGRYGEDGNMVQIEHSGGYQTLYLHLSRILVHVGQRVAQGQRIGLVGMTGMATGPHLDFRIEHNGNFEDFEQLRKKLPPAAPVNARSMAQFRQLRSRYMPELAKLQPAAPAAVVADNAAPGH